MPPACRFLLRHNPTPSDAAAIVHLHETLYASEYNFDATFADYVAGPLATFMQHRTRRERLWIAEHNQRLIGCIAIVAASPPIAQLRWFLVHPSARGHGLGHTLLSSAVSFARDKGYTSIFLWTVAALTAAARLYRAAGFQLAEQRPAHLWGIDLIEERYVLDLFRTHCTPRPCRSS